MLGVCVRVAGVEGLKNTWVVPGGEPLELGEVFRGLSAARVQCEPRHGWAGSSGKAEVPVRPGSAKRGHSGPCEGGLSVVALAHQKAPGCDTPVGKKSRRADPVA